MNTLKWQNESLNGFGLGEYVLLAQSYPTVPLIVWCQLLMVPPLSLKRWPYVKEY